MPFKKGPFLCIKKGGETSMFLLPFGPVFHPLLKFCILIFDFIIETVLIISKPRVPSYKYGSYIFVFKKKLFFFFKDKTYNHESLTLKKLYINNIEFIDKKHKSWMN
jgi:hypothetical protein